MFEEGILKASFLLLLSFTTLSLPACTAREVYGSAQTWQRNRCNTLHDKAEFDRCVNETDTTYDSYKRQTDAIRK